MDCFIGLDIGTSAVKGVVVAENGTILSTASDKFRYLEINNEIRLSPKTFLEVCFNVIKELVANVGNDNKIVSICSCCASGSLVFLDENYQPIMDIIGWQTAIDDELYQTFYNDAEKKEIYETVGWPVLNGFPIAYLPYVKIKVPDLLGKTKMLCMQAEYLNFALSGRWGISQSMGTPFYLMNQEKGIYNKKILSRFEITEKNLPPIFDKGTVIGNVTLETSNELGLPLDTKVVLGSFDHPSAAMGAGVYKEGDLLISCGTSWVEFFPVKDRNTAINTGFLVDRYMIFGSPYCVMNSLTSFGQRIDSYRKHYFGDISHKEFDEFAMKAELGCSGLKFDLSSNSYPNCDNYSKSDIARAIIESAAVKLEENLKVAEEKGLFCNSITMVGGITNSKVCIKIISETIGRKVNVINGQFAGAVGASMLAAIGVSRFSNELETFQKMFL